MGKFKNQKKNLIKNKVASNQSKVRLMKAERRKAKKDGEDTVMVDDQPVQRVRGIAVKNIAAHAAGKMENVPKVNNSKIIRKGEVPVKENKKVLDQPSGKHGTTAQYITKKKAKKMYKAMTHDARDQFRKLQAEAELEGSGDEEEGMEE